MDTWIGWRVPKDLYIELRRRLPFCGLRGSSGALVFPGLVDRDLCNRG